MNNNECVHNFGSWKKLKEPILECESMEEDSPVFLGTIYIRRCRDCGYTEERIEKQNKQNKAKKLNLKMNRKNKK